MKTKKHPHYPNPTIVEAIIEIRFSKSLENIDNEKLEFIFGSKYTLKKDELVTYIASFNPTGMSLKHDKSGQIRLKLTLGEQIFVQIFPDRFSFHWVGEYPGWDKFHGDFEHFLKQLFKALPNVLGQQIGIRFINKLEQKTFDQNVGFWLKSSPNFPDNLRTAKNDYFYRCKWPLKIDSWAQVSIAEAEMNDSFRPLMFDIDVIQQIEKPLKLDTTLSKLTVELHEEIYNIFESSISSNYKKILSYKKKGI